MQQSADFLKSQPCAHYTCKLTVELTFENLCLQEQQWRRQQKQANNLKSRLSDFQNSGV